MLERPANKSKSSFGEGEIEKMLIISMETLLNPSGNVSFVLTL